MKILNLRTLPATNDSVKIASMDGEKLCPDTLGEYLAGLVKQKRRDPLAPLDIPVFNSATNQIPYAGSPFEELEPFFGVDRNHPTTRVDISELFSVTVYPTRFKDVAFVARVVRGRVDQTCLEIMLKSSYAG